MYHDRPRDVEGSAMRQKETQTKEKEVDLKGVKGGSVGKWTKPLKPWESQDEANQLKGNGNGLLSLLFVLWP